MKVAQIMVTLFLPHKNTVVVTFRTSILIMYNTLEAQ